MPRVKKSIARTDRYKKGLSVEDTKTKSGFRLDRSKPADENDVLFCKKGDTYYSWAFAFRPVQFSLTPPRQSQLTQSEFYGAWYGIQENFEDSEINSQEDFDSVLEEIKSQCEELRDAEEEKKSNMECAEMENVPSFELVSERYDAMEEVCSELDNVEWDEVDDEDKDDEDFDLDSHIEEQKEKISSALECMCA